MIARALLMIFAIVFCFKAEAKDGRGIVYGSGMQSCGAWTYKTDSDVGEQTSWVMGYISAFNVYQGGECGCWYRLERHLRVDR